MRRSTSYTLTLHALLCAKLIRIQCLSISENLSRWMRRIPTVYPDTLRLFCSVSEFYSTGQFFSLMLWAHGGRGPRFIEPPEPPVATPLFTSQHYQVSKSEVFDKVIPAADFWISADDIAKCNNPHISQTDEILKTTMINYTRGNVRQISLIQMCH